MVATTEAARSLVIELFVHAETARDLFNACARLGRLMAELGASPSLVSSTLDNAASALATAGLVHDPARVAPARASVIEGYVAALRDAEHRAALASWDYPACVVPIGGDAVAVACGVPDQDPEALTAWSLRIAGRLTKRAVRRVVVSGGMRARTELASALGLVGITVVGDDDGDVGAGPPKSPERRSWFSLPWRR